MDLNNVGNRIKERRSVLKISQQKLADSAGLSLDMVKSIEQGRKSPSLDTLEKLCSVLQCSADYILGRTDNPEEYDIEILTSELEDMVNTSNYVLEQVGKLLEDKHVQHFLKLKELASKIIELRKNKDPQ